MWATEPGKHASDRAFTAEEAHLPVKLVVCQPRQVFIGGVAHSFGILPHGSQRQRRAVRFFPALVAARGIGIAETVVRDSRLRPGDVIIVNGTLGDHGMAIMAERSGIPFGEPIRSDVSPLWGLVEKALSAGSIHAMKDPTRGGFASAINEMARKSRVSVRISEEALPLKKSVRSASSLLGIDPLQVANEGKVIMGVAEEDAEKILAALRSHHYGRDAAIIGRVETGAHVILETAFGGERFIEPPIGDPVPRVC